MPPTPRPRVALVSALNPEATGVDRYARALAEALRAEGASVEAVRLERRELRLGPLRAGGVASLWWRRARLDPPGADVVHATDPASATRRAHVVTVHDLIPETHPEWSGGLAARAEWAWGRAVARRAPALIAVSEATRQETLRRWRVPAERVHVVHHGVDAERFRPSRDPSPLLAPDVPTLAYVGDDNPRKNLALAVSTVAALRERHGVRARLVRAGPARFPGAPWRALARERGVDLVEPGFLGDDALRALLSGAAAFLWPSLAEGFGFPPLEAMACGAPVLALDTPVNREVLGGLASFHADEPRAAADALAALLASPPPRDKLVAHAAGFTWARAARRTLEVYEGVLAR